MTVKKLIENDFIWNIFLVSVGAVFSFVLGFTLKFIKGMI
jgi:hypothetical protein